MRRSVGIGAIQKQRLEQEKYKGKSALLQESELEQMAKQLDVFRTNLEDFAIKHKNEIKKNAQFRRQFQEMCASIGVDPLASGKGFWTVLGIGDFYYELCVQIVEVCLATSEKNGGLIYLDELRERLIKARGKSKQHQEITNEDLLCAAKKLKIFGTGFSVIPVTKNQYIVSSVPGELSMDHTAILQQASNLGNAYVSLTIIIKYLNWDQRRAKNAINYLVKEGLVWVDKKNPKELLFWFPSMFAECIHSSKAEPV